MNHEFNLFENEMKRNKLLIDGCATKLETWKKVQIENDNAIRNNR